jgi:hypothetical protein
MIGFRRIRVFVLPWEKIQFDNFSVTLNGKGEGGSTILMVEMEKIPGLWTGGNSKSSDGENQIPLLHSAESRRRILYEPDHGRKIKFPFMEIFFVQAGLDQYGALNLLPQRPDAGDDGGPNFLVIE